MYSRPQTRGSILSWGSGVAYNSDDAGTFKASKGECYPDSNCESYTFTNRVYGKSSTVQPPAVSMRYIIRYTADESKVKPLIDFSNEVKQQIIDTVTNDVIRQKVDSYLDGVGGKKKICEKTYPVGSIYINYTDPTNPKNCLVVENGKQ